MYIMIFMYNLERALLIWHTLYNSYFALKSSLKLLPTFSCIWKYLTMHRSKHTLSPLFNSPALCSGLTHFFLHDSVIRPYISAIISNSTCCKVVRFCGICTVVAAMVLLYLTVNTKFELEFSLARIVFTYVR